MFLVIKLKKLICIAAIVLAVIAAVIILFRVLEAPASRETFSGETNAVLLVIDPGHGGEDGGAVSASGLKESEINLEISLKLRDISRFCGFDTVMTRDSEHIKYPESATTIAAKKVADQHSRVELINSAQNALLVSIHQNKFPDIRPQGSQVLYAPTQGSQLLGELTHQNLIAALYPENRRVAVPAPDNIYLMRSINCPGILVECGFISNPDELKKLTDNSYQLKLAAVIFSSCCQYLQMI